MDKAKGLKLGLKLGALVLAGIATILNDKVAKGEMVETVAKEVDKHFVNQVKES